MTTWVDVASTLGAAIVGGIVAPQIMQARERRLARADVRKRLGLVEATRWPEVPFKEFRTAIAEFEASAITAGLPRYLVRGYVDAATTARSAATIYEGAGPNGEAVGLLDPDSPADVDLEKSLTEMGHALWHPWLSRIPATASRRSLIGAIVFSLRRRAER